MELYININKSVRFLIQLTKIEMVSFTIYVEISGHDPWTKSTRPCIRVLSFFLFFPPIHSSPWYNRTGWLGVKYQATYLLLYKITLTVTKVARQTGIPELGPMTWMNFEIIPKAATNWLDENWPTSASTNQIHFIMIRMNLFGWSCLLPMT